MQTVRPEVVQMVKSKIRDDRIGNLGLTLNLGSSIWQAWFCCVNG
jgi:hypothetical protein